jgi:hypothetical protein
MAMQTYEIVERDEAGVEVGRYVGGGVGSMRVDVIVSCAGITCLMLGVKMVWSLVVWNRVLMQHDTTEAKGNKTLCCAGARCFSARGVSAERVAGLHSVWRYSQTLNNAQVVLIRCV